LTANDPPAVLLGGAATAVPVARSLARAGVEVTALGSAVDAIRWSRSCHRFVDLGSGPAVQERWLRWLLDEAPSAAVLLTCSDDGLQLLARHRAELAGRGLVLPELNDELALALLHKLRTYELASSAGVDAPRCVPLRGVADLDGLTGSISFPSALKPAESHLFQRCFSTRKLFAVEDEGELRDALALTEPLGLEMMLTEIVPGPDEGFQSYNAYIDPDGRPLCELTKRKPRQFPAKFGVGTYHVTDWDEEVAHLGRRFFTAVGARGLANVEFKRDARDGRLKLIESNYRFTGGTANMHAAGFDIALFVYRRLTGGPLPDMDYRRGVHLWNPIPDVRALPQYRRLGELTVGAWLRSLLHRQTFPVARLDDPLPTLVWNARRARHVLAKGLRRLR
jgi:D-aspartate ligase